MVFRSRSATHTGPFRCERTPEPELQCGSSAPKQATLENGCRSIFSQRRLVCARAYNGAMRRVGFMAMLVALLVWLAPAPWCGTCKADRAHANGCCNPASAAQRGSCCAPAAAAVLTPSCRATDGARPSPMNGPAMRLRNEQATDCSAASLSGALLMRHSRPLEVLRT